MPLQLEIVTPEKRAFVGRRGRGHRAPAARASWASCRTTRRSSRPSARACCASRAAAGGGVRHRRRLPPGAPGQGGGHGGDGRPGLRDRPGARRAGPPRGRAALEARLRRAGRPGRRAGGAAAALVRIRVAERGRATARAARGARRRPEAHRRNRRARVRWPTPARSTGSTSPSRSPARSSGSRAAAAWTARSRSAAPRTPPSSSGRGHADRRALPLHERPRDRGRARHGRDPRDLGVVVDHPAPNVYEVAAGDVDWLFVPLEAAAKMRASFILLGPAPRPLRAGHHQQPRRRPDRAAAGQPPRRRDAGAGRRDRVPQRLLLRQGARPAARRPRDASPT